MSIILRLPKDLGEGVLCASAVKVLKEFSSSKDEALLLTGSALMHGWVETFADEKFNFVDINSVDTSSVSAIVDFNIHDDFPEEDAFNVPYYALDDIEHIDETNIAYDEGAIVAPIHVVQMMEYTLKSLGALSADESIEPTAISERLKRPEVVNQVKESLGLDLVKPIGLLIPSCAANRPNKRWQPESFAKMAGYMSDAGMQPVLTGGPTDDEIDLCDRIKQMSDVHVVDACGKTGISELCSLASGSALAVGGDTGPIHLCAAAGVETFALFGRGSDPNSWRPLAQNDAAHSIWVENLAELSAEEVWDMVAVIHKSKDDEKEVPLSL